MRTFNSFEEFFPYYVGEHSQAGTRWAHFAGTHLGAVVGIKGIASRRWELLAAAPVVAYGVAWVSHFTVERNKPATFGHPVWAFRGDLQMISMMWRGRDAELGRIAAEVRSGAGVDGPAVDEPAWLQVPVSQSEGEPVPVG